MTGKQEKDYMDQISALNDLLLEQKDQINALGNERDYWKSTAVKLLEIAGFEVPDTVGPLLMDGDGTLMGLEPVREDFERLKKSIGNNGEKPLPHRKISTYSPKPIPAHFC